MNQLKLVFGICLLFLFTQSGISSNNPKLKAVQTELVSLLNQTQFEQGKVETIYVNFIINQKGEVVVVSTNDEKNDQILKNAINYHKLKATGYEVNKLYTLPIVIKK